MENFLSLPLKLRKLLLFADFTSKISLQYLCFAINVLIIITFGLCGVATIFESTEVEEVMSGVTFLTVVIVVVAKYSTIYLKWNEIQGIVRKLPQKYSAREQKYRRNFRRFSIGFKIFALLTVFAAINEALRTALKGTFEFPLHVKFPFDTSGTFVYGITIIFCMFSHILLLLTHHTSELIIYEVIFMLAMEFKILAREFEELGIALDAKLIKPVIILASRDQNKKFKALTPFYEHIKVQKLFDLIHRHSQLLEYNKKLRQILEIPLDFTFVVSSSLVCFSFFRLFIGSYAIPALMATFMLNFNKIFLQCFFGQFLRNNFQEVTQEIYNCGWEDFDEENLRKLIVLVLKRSQSDDGLKVMHFLKIDMEQFVAVSIKAKEYSLFI